MSNNTIGNNSIATTGGSAPTVSINQAGQYLTSSGWASANGASQVQTNGYGISSWATVYAGVSTHIVSFHGTGNKEIVRINNDGSVTWAADVDVDAAAAAFSSALTIGVEQKSAITSRVKSDIRDSIFESIIDLARQKGSLSADDLRYMLEASKIMEKLKSI
jgi:hypothetical protein